MKKTILRLFIVIMCVQGALAQNSAAEQEIIKLSKDKWQWMADKMWTSLLRFFMTIPDLYT